MHGIISKFESKISQEYHHMSEMGQQTVQVKEVYLPLSE